MDYKFEKSFVRDFKKVNEKYLANAILECVKSVSEAKELKEVNNLRKISGHKSAYRIRFGDYRIGLLI